MTRGVRILTWSTTVAVTVTGLLYAVFAYLVESDDPFALVNHPWQPFTLRAHVLAAPVWLVAFGVVWQAHAWPKLRAGARPRRRSGLALLVVGAIMGLSAYCLQVSVDEGVRFFWIVVHVGSSLLWLAVFALHLVVRGVTRRRVPRG